MKEHTIVVNTTRDIPPDNDPINIRDEMLWQLSIMTGAVNQLQLLMKEHVPNGEMLTLWKDLNRYRNKVEKWRGDVETISKELK